MEIDGIKVKDIIKTHLKISTTAYIIIYSIWTFVDWDFYNPIEYIKNIPNYSNEKRSYILGVFTFFHVFIFCMALPYHLEIKNLKEQLK